MPYLARAIDKARASLPGGHPGAYFSLRGRTPTLSSLFYHYTETSDDEFRSFVASARDDAEVARWIRSRASPDRLAKFERTLFGVRIESLSPDARATLFEVYPPAANQPPETLIVDLIDADDARSFASDPR